MASLFLALQSISDWLLVGIYDFSTDAFSYLVIKMTEGSVAFTIWATSFGWDVAKNVIDSLGLSTAMNLAFSSIDSQSMQIVYYLKLPEVLNTILTGSVTRYVLNFIPFV